MCCVDKTGTITENTMEVQDVIPTEEYQAEEMPPLSELLGDFTAAQSKDNITMEAMKRYFQTSSGKKQWPRQDFLLLPNTAVLPLKKDPMCWEHRNLY